MINERLSLYWSTELETLKLMSIWYYLIPQVGQLQATSASARRWGCIILQLWDSLSDWWVRAVRLLQTDDTPYTMYKYLTTHCDCMHRARDIQLDSIKLNLFLSPSCMVENIRLSPHNLDARFRISYFTRECLVEAVTMQIIICLTRVGPSTPAPIRLAKNQSI